MIKYAVRIDVKYLILFFIILISSLSSVLGQSFHKEVPSPSVKIKFLQDDRHLLNIQQVSNSSFDSQFLSANSDYLNFGISSSTYWLKVDIKNRANYSSEWYLEIEYPSLDSVYFYSSDLEGNWNVQFGGDKVSKTQKTLDYRTPLFSLNLSDSLWHSYYIKVRTEGATQIPLKLFTRDKVAQQITRAEVTEGLFYGAMLMMVLYNLFLFFSLRQLSYLYYCLFVISHSFMLAGLQGHLIYHFFPPNAWYDCIFISSFFAAIFWALCFAQSFLKIRNLAPSLSRILSLLAFVSGASFVLSYIIPYQISATLVAILVIFTPLTVWISGILAWRRGNTSARFFVLSWTLYLIFVTLIGFRNLGWSSDGILFENIIQISSCFEALLLSLALADKINIYRAEKNIAQQQALKSSLEKEQIVSNQNKILEDQVRTRTQEILEQNTKLRQFQDTITALNDQLMLYNEDLEKEVSRRTEEIEMANQKLIQQNKRLEHFAFIASHKLRGPIAQILGLVSLFERNLLSSENNTYLGFVENAAKALDTVVSDINTSLDFQENVDYQLEPITLYFVIEEVLEKLKGEIDNINVIVENKITPSIHVYAIQPYLKNIFGHLISNAFKYRDEDKPLKITISSYLKEDYLVVSVSDNGIGIDLNQYQDKIFGIYQKFHLHKKGKGMGLYLIKIQVETMGGHVEINSSPGKGTTIKIYLKSVEVNKGIQLLP